MINLRENQNFSHTLCHLLSSHKPKLTKKKKKLATYVLSFLLHTDSGLGHILWWNLGWSFYFIFLHPQTWLKSVTPRKTSQIKVTKDSYSTDVGLLLVRSCLPGKLCFHILTTIKFIKLGDTPLGPQGSDFYMCSVASSAKHILLLMTEYSFHCLLLWYWTNARFQEEFKVNLQIPCQRKKHLILRLFLEIKLPFGNLDLSRGFWQSQPE